MSPLGKVIYSMGVSLDGFIADPDGRVSVGPDEEVQPVVHPVVAGGGTPYLPPLGARMELTLIETRAFGSGAV